MGSLKGMGNHSHRSAGKFETVAMANSKKMGNQRGWAVKAQNQRDCAKQ